MPDKKTKSTVRQKKGAASSGTQMYLNVAEVKDNAVILKNGGLRSVLQTNSINFNLKSDEEQNSIVYSYQSFLNSLEFPIQILVQSRKLDIDKYIENVREKGDQHENPLLKKQTQAYCDYIQKLIEYADIMEKKFYVIVPFDPYRNEKRSVLAKFMESISGSDSVEAIKKRHKEFDNLRKGLTERTNAVKAGLEGCGLRVVELNTPQLIELFYQAYNPLTSRNEKLANLSAVNVGQL